MPYYPPPPFPPNIQVGDEVLVPNQWRYRGGRLEYTPARVMQVDARRAGRAPQQAPTIIAVQFHNDPPGQDPHIVRADEFDDGDPVLPMTAENLLKNCIDSDIDDLTGGAGLLDFQNLSQETAIAWLKVAVEGRSWDLMEVMIAETAMDLPFDALGNELLRLAFMPRTIPKVDTWSCWREGDDEASSEQTEPDPVYWASDLNDILTWICERCRVHFDSFFHNCFSLIAVGEENDKDDGVTLEHVAAMRGDTKLLVWLLEHQPAKVRVQDYDMYPFRRDRRGRTALHYAARHGQVNVVQLYRQGCAHEARGGVQLYFRSRDDFYARDEGGRTALDLAAEIEDETQRHALIAELKFLEKQIHQVVLDRIVQPSLRQKHWRKNGDSEEEVDYEFLERIVSEFQLDLGFSETDEGATFQSLFHAAEEGNLTMLRWLLEKMKVGNVFTSKDPKNHSLSLLHVAARRHTRTRYGIKVATEQSTDRNGRLRYEESEDKERFFSSWSGFDDLEEHISNFTKNEKRDVDYSWVDSLKGACGETGPERVAVVRWLIQMGCVSPGIDFIVNECDYETAIVLLQYRFDVDAVLNDWLRDRAPQAMALVGEFTFPDGNCNGESPVRAAFLCVNRFKQDPQNRCELSRLKLLKWVSSQYSVDLSSVRDSAGCTVLSVAVQNDFCLIATWLSSKFRRLVYTPSPQGKLPLHQALEIVGNNLQMCLAMLASTSELRLFQCRWTNDERVLLLADQHGKTVCEYALACCHKQIRRDAMEYQHVQKYKTLLKMVVNANTSFSEILEFCQEPEFGSYLYSHRHESTSLLHAVIGAGRLDVLSWLDRAFYRNVLPRELVKRKRRDCYSYSQLPVMCQSSAKVRVGDFLEIECCFREKDDRVYLQNGSCILTTALDGKWVLTGWIPNSDYPFDMIVYDLCGQITDTPGGKPFEFTITSSGFVKMGCHSDTWISTSAIAGSVYKLEFQRAKDMLYVETDRAIMMTKISNLETEDVPRRWRVAGVVDSTDTSLKMSYCMARWHPSSHGLGNSFDEWIPKDSPRISRTGFLRSEYKRIMFKFSADKIEPPSITGRELAMRCDRSNVVEWIDTANAIAGIQKDLRKLDAEFLHSFLSEAPGSHLEQMIAHGRSTFVESNFPTGIGESLEGSLYFLDRCWAAQPIPSGYRECHHEVPHAGLLVIAVHLNRVDRVRWILDTKQIPSASGQLRIAAARAAHMDNLTMVKEMLARGVQPIEDFGQFDHDFFLHGDNPNLLDIAVQSLSGEVACFLLDSALMPDDQLSNSLVLQCVQQHYVEESNTEHGTNQKSKSRADILERLFSRGLRPTNFAEESKSTMEEFLQTVEHMVIDPQAKQDVPIDAQTLRILWKYGGDIVSAADQYKSFRSGGDGIKRFAPQWLSNFVANIRSGDELMQRLLGKNMFSPKRTEQLLDGRDVSSLRSRCGRGLFECACIEGNSGLVEWLVTEKGADACSVNLDGLRIRDICDQLGHGHIVELLDRVGSENASKVV